MNMRVSKFLELCPNAREIREEMIGYYENIYVIRVFFGNDERFNKVFGYDIFKKVDKKGRRWVSTTVNNRWEIWSGRNKIPDLNFYYVVNEEGEIGVYNNSGTEIEVIKYFTTG